MIDAERIVALRSTLAADGYLLDIAEEGTRIRATITATPEACADCLVPKDLMRSILGDTLGVPPDAIDVTYPSASAHPFPPVLQPPPTPSHPPPLRGSHGPQDQPPVPR